MSQARNTFLKSNLVLAFSGLLAFYTVASAEDGATPGFSSGSNAPAAFKSSTTPALNESNTVLTQKQDFDRSQLLAPDYRPGNSVAGFSFLNPNRFSMRQSYSLNVSSGGMGTNSAGLYMNTLSYKLADPLTLSADVGFYTPLYSGNGALSMRGVQDPRQGSGLIFPHVGLEYKPTENTTFSLHLFNGQDAYKAYGVAGPFSPFR